MQTGKKVKQGGRSYICGENSAFLEFKLIELCNSCVLIFDERMVDTLRSLQAIVKFRCGSGYGRIFTVHHLNNSRGTKRKTGYLCKLLR